MSRKLSQLLTKKPATPWSSLGISRAVAIKLHEGKQGKHQVEHRNFQEGRSVLTIALQILQDLLNEKAGTGQPVGDHKERIDFGVVIGFHVNRETGEKRETTRGIVTYSKSGAHVVPARPKGDNNG